MAGRDRRGRLHGARRDDHARGAERPRRDGRADVGDVVPVVGQRLDVGDRPIRLFDDRALSGA